MTDRSIKRDVTRRYKKMLSSYQGKNGRVNCYVCECGKVTKTREKDDGETPMAIECSCGGNAMSTGYDDVAPEEKISYEWYRPTLDEVLKMVEEKKLFTANFVLSGGLIRREL